MDRAKLASTPIKGNLSVKIDHIFVILILLSGFLVYSHHLIPDVEVWDLGFFRIAPLASYSVQGFFYVMGIKVAPIVLLSLWYVSDDHWWRNAVMIPLAYLVFQFVSLVLNNFNFPFDNEFVVAIPVIAFYVMFLVLLRSWLQYHIRNFGHAYKIGAENLHLLPGYRNNYQRLQRIKDLLLKDQFDRMQLKLVYREYDFLKKVDAGLKESHSAGNPPFPFFWDRFGVKWGVEIFVFLLLLSMPLIFTAYELAEPGVKRYNLFFFTLHDHGFNDVRTLLWVLCTKLVVVLPVSIWFFANRYWWKYFLLIPFSIFLVQIFELFKSSGSIDGVEFFLVLPVIAVVLGMMILMSARIRRYLDLREFYEVMETKIRETVSALAGASESLERKQLKSELDQLMREHKNFSPEEYLNALKAIKKRLEDIGKEV